jgi:hypothetical protein
MTMLGGRMCRLRTSKQAIARLRNGSSNRVARMERSDIRVLHCESLPARSSCPLRVFSSPSSWRLGKSPDLASLDPGYVLRPRRLRLHTSELGIFIVKNRRETVARSFLQPAVYIASSHAGALPDCVPRAATRTDSRFGLSETAWLWSPVFPCFFCKHDKPAPRGRGLRARNKKTRRGLPPGRLAYFR